MRLRTLRLKRAFSRPDMVAIVSVYAVVVYGGVQGRAAWVCR